jgi:hypothetical protein
VPLNSTNCWKTEENSDHSVPENPVAGSNASGVPELESSTNRLELCGPRRKEDGTVLVVDAWVGVTLVVVVYEEVVVAVECDVVVEVWLGIVVEFLSRTKAAISATTITKATVAATTLLTAVRCMVCMGVTKRSWTLP